MNRFPMMYYDSFYAWFTQAIVRDWFHHHFDPKVRRHQTEVLKLAPEDVTAILILDNMPSHPDMKKFCSQDGKTRCLV